MLSQLEPVARASSSKCATGNGRWLHGVLALGSSLEPDSPPGAAGLPTLRASSTGDGLLGLAESLPQSNTLAGGRGSDADNIWAVGDGALILRTVQLDQRLYLSEVQR